MKNRKHPTERESWLEQLDSKYPRIGLAIRIVIVAAQVAAIVAALIMDNS
jgi:hypothetical protein